MQRWRGRDWSIFISILRHIDATTVRIVWAVINYRDGNEEEATAVNSSSCSAMSMLLFLGLFALLSFLGRSEEEEAITTNSLSFYSIAMFSEVILMCNRKPKQNLQLTKVKINLPRRWKIIFNYIKAEKILSSKEKQQQPLFPTVFKR